MAQTERIAEWSGGTLADLMAMIKAEALPVRIDVIAPGPGGTSAGEIHILAGGLADAFAGSLRRDDAVAALERLDGARFLVETRLPEPETGSLNEPHDDRGSLTEHPLTVLMRYCENYVLTCQVKVQKGDEQATIHYRKGEITGTEVNGSDAPERLSEVLRWTTGEYVIDLPKIPGTRPLPPAKPIPSEPKRHSTLPMVQRAELQPGASSSTFNSKLPRGAAQIPISTGLGAPTDPIIVNAPSRAPSLPAASKPLQSLPQKQAAAASVANRSAPTPQRPSPGIPLAIPPQNQSPQGALAMKAAAPITPVLSSPPTAKAKAVPSLAVPVSQRSGKVLSSNDLKPASGVIASRPGQRAHPQLPEHAAIEVPTPLPVMVTKSPATARPRDNLTPAIVRNPLPKEGRRKSRPPQIGRSRRAVRAYFYVGLAVAVGVLVTYWWFNWYLPFDNH